MAIASLRGLSHRFGGATATALLDVDLDVEPGLLAVAGRSGSGKSTLLRVLNGLVPHFHGGTISGSATVCGHDVLHTPTRVLARHVGFVFQDPETQLVGGSVVREVAFGLENLAVARPEMHARVDEALALTGIEHLAHRAVSQLSGGERQRVAIAAAIAMGGELLVLDEPTAQLDVQGSERVLDVCRRRAAAGNAVVIAEHRLDLLLDEGARIALVDAGRVRGPHPARTLAVELPAPPQVVRLGMRAGLVPVPMRAGELRALFNGGLRALPETAMQSRPVAWSMQGVDAAMQRRHPCVSGAELHGGVGEVVVLVGPNGGGKTTLLRVLAGLTAPLRGSIERRPGRIALLPQNPTAVLHRDTVRAEVQLTLRRTHEDAPGAVEAVLAELGLTDLDAMHPRDLSSGQRQRAALATMLCGHPRLALLDEPTRGMDHDARTALVGMVRRLAAEGASVVLATHDAELAAEVGDRIVEVRDGRATDLGPPRRALTGASPYATQIGALLANGPVTVEEALQLL
jgi:energy-coupling factor transporter ATP-binding protein EcfA2